MAWPIIAAIAGGAIDAASNAYQAYQQSEENKKQRKYEKEMAERKAQGLKTIGGQTNAAYNQMMDIINEQETGRTSYLTPEMEQQYINLLENYEPQTYDFDQFQYDKTVEDFINPEASKIAEMAGLQTQADLAGQGAAKGTAGLANMGYSRWKAAEDLYKDAQNQMLAERSQAYQEYGDYIDRMQKKLDTVSQGQLQKALLLGGAIGQEQQAKSDYMADLLSVMGDKAASNANIGLAAYS